MGSGRHARRPAPRGKRDVAEPRLEPPGRLEDELLVLRLLQLVVRERAAVRHGDGEPPVLLPDDHAFRQEVPERGPDPNHLGDDRRPDVRGAAPGRPRGAGARGGPGGAAGGGRGGGRGGGGGGGPGGGGAGGGAPPPPPAGRGPRARRGGCGPARPGGGAGRAGPGAPRPPAV